MSRSFRKQGNGRRGGQNKHPRADGFRRALGRRFELLEPRQMLSAGPLDSTPGVGCAVGEANPEQALAATGLRLTDASGAPLSPAMDDNTLLVGAATWCGACAQFKAQLAAPRAAEQLEGLRIVFAFGDEGGTGPGGVLHPEFLENLPGEVVFLAADSVRPDRFPSTFNPASNQFDAHPVTAINAWLNRSAAAASGEAAAASPGAASATPSDKAPSDCGCGSKSAQPAENAVNDLPAAAVPTAASTLIGDYNRDGVVDRADAAVWSETVGSDSNLRADGNQDAVIDERDLDVWTAHYGNMLGDLPGAFAITAPSTPSSTDDIIVQWEASSEATSYELVISTSPDLSSPVFSEVVVDTAKAVFDLGEGTFYIGVFASNTAGTTAATNSPYYLDIAFNDLRQMVFVTDEEFYIDELDFYPPDLGFFGSAAAADYHCTRIAAESGLLNEPWDYSTIHFTAMVALNSVDLANRAGVANQGFVNVLGQEIADDRAQLYSGNHTAPILSNSGQVVAGGTPVWTGSTSSGEWSPFTCADWSNPFAAGGAVGTAGGSGTSWLSHGTHSCQLGARFYCISVGSSDTLEPEADAGGPYTLDDGDGNLVLMTAVADDIEGTLSYSWDINGDGTFGDLGGPSASPQLFLTWNALVSFLGSTPTVGSVFNVRVRIDDGGGGITDSPATPLTIVNDPPTATFDLPPNPTEGSTLWWFGFSNPQDTSAADATDGFQYSFDLDGDGIFGPEHLRAFPDDGEYTVRGRVTTINDGAYTEYEAMIAVGNVAPVIALSGDASTNAGTSYELTLGAISDPGSDTVTEWIVDWGDGSSDNYASGGVKTHVYVGGPIVRDITVSLVDEDGTHPAAGTLQVTVESLGTQIVGRHIFYNQSKFDGNTAGISASDDLAVAIDKSAYLPGSGVATFANITSYSRGINGIMVDLLGAAGTLSVDDFTFRMSTQTSANNTPSTWSAAPAPTGFSVRAGAGVSGSDRVEIIWAPGDITNRWLEVIVEGNDAIGGNNTNTGLVQSDRFYFGNRIGDTGSGSPALAVTSALDEIAARGNAGFGAAITNLYDFDRSGLVSSVDNVIARNNAGTLTKINLADPPAVPVGSDEDSEVAFALAVADGKWMDGWAAQPAIVHPGASPVHSAKRATSTRASGAHPWDLRSEALLAGFESGEDPADELVSEELLDALTG